MKQKICTEAEKSSGSMYFNVPSARVLCSQKPKKSEAFGRSFFVQVALDPPSLDHCTLDVWLWHAACQLTPQFLSQQDRLASCDGNVANVCVRGWHQPSQTRSILLFCKAGEIASLYPVLDDLLRAASLDKYNCGAFKMA